ncbi:MAG: rhodanese-like domain-containing protein [Flavobacteriaceae bacterium]
MKNIFLIAILCCGILFNCTKLKTNPSVLISAEQMLELVKLEEVQLIDVRTPGEFAEGHIENAKNIDFYSANFDLQIDALDKSIPVILYCKSGGRSAKCVSKLKLKGFKVIYDLQGGINHWGFEGRQIYN